MNCSPLEVKVALSSDLCLRVAAFCSFSDWVGTWRPLCTALALGPEWYAEAAPNAAISVVDPERSEVMHAIMGSTSSSGSADSDQEKCPKVVIMLPGDYAGPWVVRQPVHLVGWGISGGVRLTCEARQGLHKGAQGRDAWLLFAEGCGAARISNLNIEAPAAWAWAVCVAGDEPSLVGCTVRGPPGGIVLRGGAATLSRCTVEYSNGNGILVESACGCRCPRILHSVIRAARVDGICLDAAVRLENCTVEGNGRHGILIAADVLLNDEDLRARNDISASAWGNDIFRETDLSSLNYSLWE